MKITKFVLLTLLGIIITSTIALKIYTWDNHLLIKGAVISGIEVGNLTKDQARDRINEAVKKWLTQSVKLEVNGEVIELSLEKLEPFVDIEPTLNEAYDLGRKGSILDKAKSKMNTSDRVHFDLTPNWDDKKLSETFTANLSKYNIAPINASFHINELNVMELQREQPGKSIETEPLIAHVKKTQIFQDPGTIKVIFKEEKPSVAITNLENEKITGLLASYTSKFDSSLLERTENVLIAAKALDGALIKPGETISFNGIVGERVAEKGYQDAYIIVNGEFVPGLGGGICQVSSTLYNAGLLANLSIEERSNHELAINYVPLGQDATVAYPDLDLKLKNDTGGYLLIRSKVTKNSLTIDLYGKVKPGQEVIISNKIESVIPPTEQTIQDSSIAQGEQIVKQQGQPGYIASAYRTVKLNGIIIKTENLGKSNYKPVPKIIAIGQLNNY